METVLLEAPRSSRCFPSVSQEGPGEGKLSWSVYLGEGQWPQGGQVSSEAFGGRITSHFIEVSQQILAGLEWSWRERKLGAAQVHMRAWDLARSWSVEKEGESHVETLLPPL